MHTLSPTTWAKTVMAAVVVLIIGGPGVVLADADCPDYLTPRSARLLGPAAVPSGQTRDYTLQVFFQDGSSTKYGFDAPQEEPGATFTVSATDGGGAGFFTLDDFTATSSGRVILKGSFTNECGTVESTRRVRIP